MARLSKIAVSAILIYASLINAEDSGPVEVSKSSKSCERSFV
jgi:hypothetical protein